eukprot:TRINITY_DN364_c0_g1_i1.p1 TRINITY_DN364_c0_g1~~TRINITY_DN364_c0_g1_i1.p1  ORF type:complete len:119 (-),score=7.65 TRINITY_DN364_c0_g1_i1:170-526(-)
MATSMACIQSPVLIMPKSVATHPSALSTLRQSKEIKRHGPTRRTYRSFAAKLPSGVELPKEEPKLPSPFLGFTNTAEVWNSRACMIGLIGTFVFELVFQKGILQVIGVDVGKGLNIPL